MTVATLPPDANLPAEAVVARGYEWHLAENCERALEWVRTAHRTEDAETKTFLTSALVDLVHYDRATRASDKALDGIAPVREAHIVQAIEKGHKTYKLVRKPLSWEAKIPFEAVDTVARVASASPPDKFWIAKYFYCGDTLPNFDPVIYAEYGAWLVELATMTLPVSFDISKLAIGNIA